MLWEKAPLGAPSLVLSLISVFRLGEEVIFVPGLMGRETLWTVLFGEGLRGWTFCWDGPHGRWDLVHPLKGGPLG